MNLENRLIRMLVVIFISLAFSAAIFARNLGSPREDASQFIEKIPEKLFLKFDETKLRKIISSFNEKQIPQAKEGDENLRQAGMETLEYQDAGKFFIIHIKKTENSHSSGIDGGIDEISSVLYSKRPLKEVLNYFEFIQKKAFYDSNLQLTFNMREDCLGGRADFSGAGFTVHNLNLKIPIFKGKLDLQGESITGHKISFNSKNDRSLLMSINTDGEYVDPPQTGCEVTGEKIIKRVRDYELTCSGSKNRCQIRSLKVKKFIGCPEIGGCD